MVYQVNQGLIPRVQPVVKADLGGAVLQGLQTGLQTQAAMQQQEARGLEIQARQRQLGLQEEEQRQKVGVMFAAENLGKPKEEVVSNLGRRYEQLKKEGRDTSHTEAMIQKYAAGDERGVQELLGKAVQLGQQRGWLAAPKAPDQSEIERIAASKYPVGSPGYQQEVDRLFAMRYGKKGPQTVVSVGAGETEERKQLAKIRTKQYETVQTQAQTARETLNSLDALDFIQPNIQGGALEAPKQKLAELMDAFGMDSSEVANIQSGQAFNALKNQMVLKVMQAQKGPQTESDMRLIQTTTAQLGNTPEANRFINNYARAVNQRMVDKEAFFDDWLSRKDSLKGAQKSWNEMVANTPLVSDLENPRTGLPMFYFEFEQAAREVPGQETLSNDQIRANWKKRVKSRKAKRFHFGAQPPKQTQMQQARPQQMPMQSNVSALGGGYPAPGTPEYLNQFGLLGP